MNSVLTDSIAREHAADVQAAARRSRRVREARNARRAARARRRAEQANHSVRIDRAAHTVGHAAARPFVAAQHWIAAGQL